ncbi:MAG: 1-phosphofructokinase [Ruminococcaceae bacterium]|nr:1-phosphofructokinase [Oscillospiraceae bacterium]
MKKTIMTVTLNPCIDKTIVLNGFCEGGLNRAKSVRTDAGGKGINVAKVLKRFDAAVLAVGVIGEGGSEIVLSELDERGICRDFVKVSGETRTNYKLQDKAKGQVTEVNESGFFVNDESLEKIMSLIKSRLPEVGVMVLSGSVAPGIPTDIYKRLITLAKEQGILVILDADGAAFKEAIEAAPYAVKPNRFELEQFFGRELPTDGDLLACGRALIDRGISLVVVSLGAEGAVFITKDEAIRVNLAPLACQSTVGAGDSMVASVAASLVEEADLLSLARRASAAGTVTASKPGTEVCTKEEVSDYEKRLTITVL